MITGRAVCSCPNLFVKAVNSPSVVYEKELARTETQQTQERGLMSIRSANQLGANIKHEFLQSLTSADRYPRGVVGMLDSQLIAGMMGTHFAMPTVA